MRSIISFVPLLGLLACFAAFATPHLDAKRDNAWAPWLPGPEASEVQARLHRFFARPHDPTPMNERVPKYDETGAPVTLKPFLRDSAIASQGGLAALAQGKAAEGFHESECRARSRFFPGFHCDDKPRWSSIDTDDKVATLVRTWIPKSETKYELSDLPTKGKTELPLWSDDYWRWQYGGLSYRYANKNDYDSYDDAIKAYEQPSEWEKLVDAASPEKIAEAVLKWSPAEKYDVTVGDADFTLTLEQREEGEDHRNNKGEVEDWMGICQGWAAAAIRVPKPVDPVTTVGMGGTQVTWYPADIRALTSLAWADTRVGTNFIGGRCNEKKLVIYGNGHLLEPECFDTNPATFHLALGNLIGRHHLSLVMDKSFDYEVWNQPIESYHLTYFNPTDPDQKNDDWTKVAVDYDKDFKDDDRFQTPVNTRGKRIGREKYDDSGIKKVVGVVLTVNYLEELSPPPHSPKAPKEKIVHETYTYDLELSDVHGKLVPTGGEWYQNSHPDFLWLPQKGTFPGRALDTEVSDFKINVEPSPELTETAVRGSRRGYPLCPIVKKLVEKSSGVKGYTCPEE